LGVTAITAADLHEWTATWFTRANAVLWIAGPAVPTGLRLTLPDGERRPTPSPSSALPSTPAYFVGEPGRVVFDGLVGRTTPAMVCSGVLDRELFRALRREGGYSYVANASYDALDRDQAIITAIADSPPDRQAAMLGEFLDVLKRLEVGAIDAADIDSFVSTTVTQLRNPEADAARLPFHAFNLLTGYRAPSIDELVDDLRAVTATDVHAVAVELCRTGLIQVPPGTAPDWAGFVAAPTHSAGTVDGTHYRSREYDELGAVVGPDGASLVSPAGPVTVRFDECEALLAWPDGARVLVGTDGNQVKIEPTLFHGISASLPAIDAAIPDSKVITMPARQPDEIPQPEVIASVGVGSRLTGRVRALATVLAFAAATLAAAAMIRYAVTLSPSSTQIIVIGAVAGWLWLAIRLGVVERAVRLWVTLRGRLIKFWVERRLVR
jgi:hypothetical protein